MDVIFHFLGSPPVNGGWCSWFQLTPCSVSCGYGSQVMMRYCSCPSPSNGGSNCTGPARRTESCYAGYCPTSSSTTTSSSIPMPRPSPSPVPGMMQYFIIGSRATSPPSSA